MDNLLQLDINVVEYDSEIEEVLVLEDCVLHTFLILR